MQIIRLAMITPMRGFFDYLPPQDMSKDKVNCLEPGIRILAPFGHQKIVGILLEVSSSTTIEQSALKRVLVILDQHPLISKEIFALCKWSHFYYHHPPGEVFGSAFSTRLRRGLALPELGKIGWHITCLGRNEINKPKPLRSKKQAFILSLLNDHDLLTQDDLNQRGASYSAIYSLKKKGYIKKIKILPERHHELLRKHVEPNSAQATICASIHKEITSFKCHLIEGITGSGKTEIYLQLIYFILQQKKQILILIPEINLTPQTILRVKERFNTRIAELHSGLTDAARNTSWALIQKGLADIVIGTRSACFAPCSRLGIIIVDEEHDSAYKQQDGFRYSARDVAIKRAQIANCPVVLGSATPSLETLFNVSSGKYMHHKLTRRVGGANLPKLNTIDIRGKKLTGGLSNDLLKAVKTTVSCGEQVLLFLNRRGYATQFQCHDCGWVAACSECDSRMIVHKAIQKLRCHHCGKSTKIMFQCPGCSSTNLLINGVGTQQAEEIIKKMFPAIPIHRVDSDKITNKLAMQKLVELVSRRKPCILIGTQMLAKGHHFPGVTLVGIIDVDSMLFGGDFRGEEYMSQLLTQVAGRAGRESKSSNVMLQSHYPDHPFIKSVIKLSYSKLAVKILDEREKKSLPPSGHLMLIRADSKNSLEGERFLQKISEQSNISSDVRLIGPLPSAMPRRAGKYRNQLLLHSKRRVSIHKAATKLISVAENLPKKNKLSWFIDVDPIEIC